MSRDNIECKSGVVIPLGAENWNGRQSYLSHRLIIWRHHLSGILFEALLGQTSPTRLFSRCPHMLITDWHKKFMSCQRKYAIAIPRTSLFCKFVTRSRMDLSFWKYRDHNCKHLQGTPRTQVAEDTIDIRHIQRDNVVQFSNRISPQSPGAICSL